MWQRSCCTSRLLTMPVPLACPVFLTTADQAQLASLVRAHCTPHALVFRCRLILRTAAPEQPANLPVATAMHCERHSVGRWRHRSRTPGLKGLQEAPRAGRPRRFSPAAPVAVLSIAARKPATDSCSAPPLASRGSGRGPPAAPWAADHAALQPLAHPGGGRPQAAA